MPGNQTPILQPNQPPTIIPENASPDIAMMMHTPTFEHMQRVAKMYAESKFVPDTFRGDIASCTIAVELSVRIQVSPILLMQQMVVIHGRPSIQGQLAIAMINKSGMFENPLDFVFEYAEQNKCWACTAKAVRKDTGQPCELRIDWNTVEAEGWASKNGSKWKTMPEQMFRYRTASWLGRAYCPEVLLGMQTTDEAQDIEESRIWVESTSNQASAPSIAGRLETVGQAGEVAEAESHTENTATATSTTDIAEPQPQTDEAKTKRRTKKMSPKKDAESTSQAPEPWEMLIESLSIKASVTDEIAEKELQARSQKLHGCELSELTQPQIAALRKRVDSGGITITKNN